MAVRSQQPENIVVVCEYCKARMAISRDENLPTCYICGGRMLPDKAYEEDAKCLIEWY
jgi:rRNA maturation endonuclease Nob1